MTHFLWGLLTGASFTLLSITLTSWFTKGDYRRAFIVVLQAVIMLLFVVILGGTLAGFIAG